MSSRIRRMETQMSKGLNAIPEPHRISRACSLTIGDGEP